MIIYARTSSARKPRFQMITTIEQNGDRKIVHKTALSAAAVGHTKQIFNNYSHLKKAGTGFKLAKPARLNDSSLAFDYIEGQRLDSVVYEAIRRHDLNTAHKIIDKVIDLIKSQPQVKLTPKTNSQFVKVFGRVFGQSQLCNQVGYIDYNLDNIIQMADDYYLYDYDWLFDFPIPTDLLVGRMLLYCFYNHNHFYRTIASTQSPVISVGDHIFIAEPTYLRYKKYLDQINDIRRAEDNLGRYVHIRQPKLSEQNQNKIKKHTSPLEPSITNKLEHEIKQLAEFKKHTSRVEGQVTQLQNQLNRKNAQLQEILNSKTWRYASRAKKIIGR